MGAPKKVSLKMHMIMKIKHHKASEKEEGRNDIVFVTTTSHPKFDQTILHF